jgi:hypothetical protein
MASPVAGLILLAVFEVVDVLHSPAIQEKPSNAIIPIFERERRQGLAR